MGFKALKATHLRELARWVDTDPDECKCRLEPAQVLQRVAEASVVPTGWNRLLARVEREFDSATRCVPNRRMVGATDVAVYGRKGFVALNKPDPVVRGILRKAMAQARCTCQCCGRRGAPWPAVDAAAVLCSGCLIKRIALKP